MSQNIFKWRQIFQLWCGGITSQEKNTEGSLTCSRINTITLNRLLPPPGRHPAIIWTNTGMILIGPIWTTFNDILRENLTFRKIRLNVSSAKWWPFCFGLNELLKGVRLTFEGGFILQASLSRQLPFAIESISNIIETVINSDIE